MRLEDNDLDFDFGNYKWFRIEISDSGDLSFLGIEFSEGNIGNSFLSWVDENENKLHCAADYYEVFTGTLPNILVQKASLFRSGKFALFADFGNGPERQKTTGSSEEFVLSLDTSTGTKGEIWVESITRIREFAGRSVIDRLSFCLLPQCVIEWPAGLLENDEISEIRIHTVSDIRFKYEGCIPLDNNSRTWRIPAGKRLVEGILKTGHVSIRLAHRIFRAAFRKKSDSKKRYFEKIDLIKGIELVAEGLPKAQADIFLICGNKNKCYPLVELGCYSVNGKISFSSYSFLDASEKVVEPVGTFALRGMDKIVRTEAIYLDSEGLKRSLVNGNFRNEWCENLGDEKLSSFLNGIEAIIRGTNVHISDDFLEGLPESISKWGRDVIDCAVVFDDVFSENFNENTLHAGLCWYRKAESFCKGKAGRHTDLSADGLLGELKKIPWRPEFPRWKRKFEKVVDGLTADTDLAGLVKEWAEEVIGDSRLMYKSRISSREMGGELTVAWRSYYHHKQYAKAYQRAKRVFEMSQSPVKDLACILLNVSLVKNNSLSPLIRANSFLGNAELAHYIDILCYQKSENREQCEKKENINIPSFILPLREEDRCLFESGI